MEKCEYCKAWESETGYDRYCQHDATVADVSGIRIMKKKFDVYVNKKWERNEKEEKEKYPDEEDPMYWHYVDFCEEFSKHPRIVKIK